LYIIIIIISLVIVSFSSVLIGRGICPGHWENTHACPGSKFCGSAFASLYFMCFGYQEKY